jgi:hypothetical protein
MTAHTTRLERAIERQMAERVERGLPPLIESPSVFCILDAVLAQQAEQETAKTN